MANKEYTGLDASDMSMKWVFDRAKPPDQYKYQLGRLNPAENDAVTEGRIDWVVGRFQSFGSDPAEMQKQIDAMVKTLDEELPRIQRTYSPTEAGNYQKFRERLLEIRPKE